MRVAQVVRVLEALYPLALAEDWDHPGLIVGDPSREVRSIVCAVDPTLAVVQEATRLGADMLITHHPLLFRAVHSVAATEPHGAVVSQLYEHHCALWVGHTNADAAPRGVAAAAAACLGLTHTRALVPAAIPEDMLAALRRRGALYLESKPVCGLGRVGLLEQPETLANFAQRVDAALPPTALGIQISGEPDQMIRSVAVLPGAGDSLLDAALSAHADVYVTSDLRHHPALDLRERALLMQGTPMALINTPHAAIESLWFRYAVSDISAALANAGVNAPSVRYLEQSTDPWRWSITHSLQ